MKEYVKFFGIVGCMDGRSVLAFADYADTIKMNPDILCVGPGIVAALADPKHPGHTNAMARLREQMIVSVEKHSAEFCLVGGHPKCAGYPVDDDEHKATVLKAADAVLRMARELEYDNFKAFPVWNGSDTDSRFKVQFFNEEDRQLAA